MNVNVYPLPKAADPNDQGEPELVSEAGTVHEWLLEADMTSYRIIVVRPQLVGLKGRVDRSTLNPTYAYVMSTIAGGERSDGGRIPRWPTDGGGAWYPFAREGYLAPSYVAEKFRLNDVDAYHVTQLIAAALERPASRGV